MLVLSFLGGQSDMIQHPEGVRYTPACSLPTITASSPDAMRRWRDRALWSQEGLIFSNFSLYLCKWKATVKPVTTLRQASPLLLAIPALLLIILSFEFPIEKESSVRLPHGNILFCPSCHSPVCQMSQQKASTWSHFLTTNKHQKVRRGISETIRNKVNF